MDFGTLLSCARHLIEQQPKITNYLGRYALYQEESDENYHYQFPITPEGNDKKTYSSILIWVVYTQEESGFNSKLPN
jgi:hypothetical protein